MPPIIYKCIGVGNDYAVQFYKSFGTPTYLLHMAISALISNPRLGLTDEDLAERMRMNFYLQVFTDQEDFQYAAPLIPLMMVYFQKQPPQRVVNDYNKGVVHHELDMIRSFAVDNHDDGSHRGGNANAADQQIGNDRARPYQGSWLIDDMTQIPINV